MFGIAAFVKQTSVHARMQSLDPALKHLRKSGEAGNVADRNFFLSQQFGRTAGRNDVDTLSFESARKFGDAAFIGNGNECSRHFHLVVKKSQELQRKKDATIVT